MNALQRTAPDVHRVDGFKWSRRLLRQRRWPFKRFVVVHCSGVGRCGGTRSRRHAEVKEMWTSGFGFAAAVRNEANESATVWKEEKRDTVVPDIPAMVVM